REQKQVEHRRFGLVAVVLHSRPRTFHFLTGAARGLRIRKDRGARRRQDRVHRKWRALRVGFRGADFAEWWFVVSVGASRPEVRADVWLGNAGSTDHEKEFERISKTRRHAYL